MELELVRRLAGAALRNLEANRQRIDDLNVYPVPDGDTGTNLVLTLRGVVDALARVAGDDPAVVAHEASRAALLSARGNSGVILSQIVRGFAEGVGASEDDVVRRLVRGFRSGSDAAYRAVREPSEGTMLTAIHEMAEEAERRAAEGASPLELVRAVVERGDDAVSRTPEQLDVLRRAGVVDAGAAGLVEIVRGAVLEATGEQLPEAPVSPGALGLEAIHQELSRYRYCTTFVVEGNELDCDTLERQLETLGDSLLVVGDRSAVKVHVHTDDPGAALTAGTAVGVIGGVEIANMHLQATEREERLLATSAADKLATALVVVAQGAGNKRLFEDLGASLVVEGGATMNPSAAEIAAAVDAAPSEAVVVLPNDANVVLAAEQVAGLTSKNVRVVPSVSIQAGFAAAVRFVATNDLDENEEDMREALASISTGEVAVASRDAQLDGVAVRKGSFLGLVNGEAVASDEAIEDVLRVVVERVLAPEHERIDAIVGQGAPPADSIRTAIEILRPNVDVEVHEGGQPHYPVLLVAE